MITVEGTEQNSKKEIISKLVRTYFAHRPYGELLNHVRECFCHGQDVSTLSSMSVNQLEIFLEYCRHNTLDEEHKSTHIPDKNIKHVNMSSIEHRVVNGLSSDAKATKEQVDILHKIFNRGGMWTSQSELMREALGVSPEKFKGLYARDVKRVIEYGNATIRLEGITAPILVPTDECDQKARESEPEGRCDSLWESNQCEISDDCDSIDFF